MGKVVRVLIVESDQQDIQLILSLLERNKNQEYSPQFVPSLESAEDKLISNPYDIVLFGLSVSDKANLEFIKNLHGIFQIPLILLSSVKDEKVIKENRIDYVVDCINKHSLAPIVLSQAIKFGLEKNLLKQKLYKAEKKARYLTTRDSLTGLLNRSAFFEQLNSEINSSRRNKLQFGLFLLGLNNLKDINKCYGHGVGDQLLTLVSERLQKRLRQEDDLARITGDEFGVLVSNIDDSHSMAKIAVHILKLFDKPFEVEDKQIDLSACLGITVFPNDGVNLEEIVRNADIALNVAKEKGLDYQYYTDKMNKDVSHHLNIESDFRRGLEQGEFFLQFQPIIESSASKIVCAEALVRWQHPVKGLLPPDSFIPTIEKSELISDLGRWVLYQACRQNKLWQDAGLPQIRVAVNISAKQIVQQGLVTTIKEILKETQLHPNWLEIELTEHVFMQDVELATDVINQLKELGIQISIDDFGTGFSSLSYLKCLPIDKLKVDKSFVHSLHSGERDTAIVKAIISMAQSLTIKTVAEGIENTSQRNSIEEMGCDYMQGFFFQEPVESSVFSALLNNQASQAIPKLAI